MTRSALSIFTLTLACSLAVSLRTQAQMVEIAKEIINQFMQTQPTDYEDDETIAFSVPFPVETTLDQKLYVDALKETGKLLTITDFQNGYSEIDGEDYPTNSFTLVFSYLTLPCFQCVNGWYEDISVVDTEGKDLLMEEKEVDRYRELGIINDEFDFPMPGEFSETYWLNRELKWEEKITVSGVIKLEYPDVYESLILTGADTTETYSLDSITYRLISIDRNIATLLIKADPRETEGVKMIILNKDDLPFYSQSSVAIDAGKYDLKNKTVREITDDEIQTALEGYDMSDPVIEQVKKIEVNGNIVKLVFIKISKLKTIEQPFKVEMATGGY